MRFTADLRPAGLAYVRLLLSPHAAGRLATVDLSAAAAAPGVLAAVSGRDLPAGPATGPEAPLAVDRVHYAGQPVVAVVAETEAQAADAIALVEIEYQPLPAVIDPLEAMRDGAPTVLEGVRGGLDDGGAHGLAGIEGSAADRPPNVTAQVRLQSGDAEEAFTAAQVVIEGRYHIPAVHQGFIEPHVAAATPEPDGGLTIHGQPRAASSRARRSPARWRHR